MDQLSRWDGVDVYRKEDIPDHLRFRENDLVLDVLVVSRGRAKVGSTSDYPDKFLPPGDGGQRNFSADTGGGHHGWDDTSPDPDGYEEGNIKHAIANPGLPRLAKVANPNKNGQTLVYEPRKQWGIHSLFFFF